MIFTYFPHFSAPTPIFPCPMKTHHTWTSIRYPVITTLPPSLINPQSWKHETMIIQSMLNSDETIKPSKRLIIFHQVCCWWNLKQPPRKCKIEILLGFYTDVVTNICQAEKYGDSDVQMVGYSLPSPSKKIFILMNPALPSTWIPYVCS